MIRQSVSFVFAVLIAISFASVRADEPHRSPAALAISPDRSHCLTANKTAGTVSLIDLSQQQICCELAIGLDPADIVWLDESEALVSLQAGDRVAVIRCDHDLLSLVRTIEVGTEPRGLAVSRRHHRAYVALGGDDAVAVLDLDRLKKSDPDASNCVVDHLSVGGLPRTLTVSPDDQYLVTCCAYPCEVFVHDIESSRQISARKVFDGAFNPGRTAVSSDSKLVILPSAVNRAFSVTAGMIDIGWVIDNRLSKLTLPDGEPADQKQLGLDIRGQAVGDANAVALSPDGQFIVVTCGGTHELLVLEFPTIDWPKGDPGDFLPERLKKDPLRFRRIPLGGRPVDVQFVADRRLVVANYLSDSVQFVDIDTNQVTGTIPLGSPTILTETRRGEVVFYDANRSMHSWFSCHTCHPDGHTSAQVFDTRNDQSYGTPKLTPSLRGVIETSPWTWHGWQTDLKDSMKRSLKESMHTEQAISDDDAASLVAFLGTLSPRPNPRADSKEPLVVSGRQLFEGRAGCVKCHTQPTYTSSETFDGAVDDPKDKNKLYSPPSLRGIFTRRRFLHTGKAKSLEQVLTKYHRPEDLVGESLSDDEVASLVAFLKTL